MQPEVEQPVVIVGAGIVGIAAALWLRRRGRRVLVLDRDGVAAGASRGNGGVLAAAGIVPVPAPGLLRQAPSMLGGPLFLRWSYLPRAAPWLARYLVRARAGAAEATAAALAPLIGDSLEEHQALAAGTGAEGFVIPSDYAYLYRSRAAREADDFGWSVRRRHGFRWTEESGAEFCARETGFAGVGWSVRLHGHGHITDPAAYVEALADHFRRAGGEIRRGRVEAVLREGGRLTGLRVDGATLPTRAVVLATGAWSAGLLAPLGLRIPLESERGYHLDLWEPDWMPSHPVMVAWGKVVITPMRGRIRVAGLVEYGGLEAGPSPAPVRFLKRLARSVFPRLGWRREESWMGHRPVLADSVPAIGAVPGVAGLYAAFGHQHVGLTGGPATGRIIAALVTGERINRDVAPYALARFT
jgi:D-amino-acid dehydrogenase